MRHSSRRGNETIVTSVYCGTRNRILVHTALYSAIICPYTSSSRYDGLVEVFSEGWTLSSLSGHTTLPVEYVHIDKLGKDVARTVTVEFIGKESASYSVMWLEISRRYINVYNNNHLQVTITDIVLEDHFRQMA